MLLPGGLRREHEPRSMLRAGKVGASVEFLRQLVSGTAEAWSRLSVSARVNLIIAAIATVLAVGIVAYSTTRPQFVQLYAGLSAEESSEIQAVLREQRVPFEVQQRGQVIRVPLAERDRLITELAAQQLPRTHGTMPGFEMFDRPGLMTNQYLQDIRYKQLVQGSLQNMLVQFHFVRNAFVFLHEGKESLFLDHRQPAEAAVTIDVTRMPTEAEVRGLLHVISSFGGANLDLNNITLTTTDGVPLHLPPENDFAGIANSRLAYQRQFEDLTARKIRRAFDEIGVRAMVTVSADIDASTMEETYEQMEEGAVVASLIEEREMSSTESLPVGPPGLASALPPGAPTESGLETTENSFQQLQNYEPSRRITRTNRPPGDVRNLKVGVMVMNTFQNVLDDTGQPTGEQEYVPWAEDQIEKFREMVVAAAGVSREDVFIEDHLFDAAHLPPELAAVTPTPAWDVWPTVGYVLWALAALVALLMVRRFLRRLIVPAGEAEPEEVFEPQLSPEELRQRRMVEAVEQFSERQPETAAALLRTWLAEDREP